MPETVAIFCQTECAHNAKRCNLIRGKLRRALTTFTCNGIAQGTVNKQEKCVTLSNRVSVRAF